MKITKLEAENFKRLKAIEIEPDGNTVVIGGRNAQGKSSVLDAIMAALAGRKGSKELVRPIRDGESKARVVVELDDLRVERKWTQAGSTIQVSPKDGTAKLNSPQAVLDRLIGALAFDPLEFAEADPKKQVETLIDIIGREAFDALAAERRAAYDRRTESNRLIKRLEAQIERIPRVDVTERVDVGAISDELDVAHRKAALRAEWEKLHARMNEIEAEAKILPATRTPETLMGLLRNAQEINKAADAFDQRQELTEELNQQREESLAMSDRIQSLDENKARLLAEAPLPIEGLAFDEDGVTFNGVPFQQSSAAERLKVSVAMAMAMNPELRVICIRDASLLDSDSRAALVAMAKERDYQIWYEVVGDPGEVGVLIEDGAVG